ncbi:MAG: flagellar filament capping protein FliD [Sulfuricellaceae bacterium]
MILSSIFANSANANANGGSSVPVDVYNKVSKIMQTQSTAAPKLNAALSIDKTTLSALGQMQSALASFQKIAQSFSGVGFSASASSSAKEVLTATASDSALTGAYAIQVTQLAQNQVLRSANVPRADAPLGNEAAAKISFEFGSTTGNVFSANTAAKTVDIPSGAKTLQGIAAAVNGANIGVNAKVVPSGAGYALEFVSSGGGSMRIGVSNDLTLKDFMEYDPSGTKNLSQVSAAQNAQLTINGVTVESPSNSITGAVLGATLNLNATGSSKLEVTQGSGSLFQNVTNLVSAYNTLNAKLSALQQGDLKTDGTALQTQNQLARIFASAGNGATGISAQALAKIGISTQKNGDLVINTSKLQNAVSADPAGVGRLFSNGGSGIADNLAGKIQGMVGPSGSLPKKVAAINQDITTLNAKKSTLEAALTKQANALAKYYSQQQSAQTNPMWATSTAGGASSGNKSLFDALF